MNPGIGGKPCLLEKLALRTLERRLALLHGTSWEGETRLTACSYSHKTITMASVVGKTRAKSSMRI